MATNKKKPTLDDLKEHLFKYKDATIVVGNDIILDKEMFLPYNSPADYSRKSMVKTPEKFWRLYKESVYKEDVDTKNNNQQIIQNLIDLGIVKTLIDNNSDGVLSDCGIDYIQLQGNYKVLKCNKCNKKVPYDPDKIPITNKPLTHNMYEDTDCYGKLMPTLPFANSIMSSRLTEELEEAIFNLDPEEPMHTHTLIFIGVDFDDNVMDYMIDKFNTVKTNPEYIAKYPNDVYYTVIISDEDELPILAYGAEFGTAYLIEDSLSKLYEVLKS